MAYGRLHEENHRATAPRLNEDDVPVNMQQTLSAEAIPVYDDTQLHAVYDDTQPHAYAVATPVNAQQSALASSSFETTSLPRSGQTKSLSQKIGCLFLIIFFVVFIAVMVYTITKAIESRREFDDHRDN
jgi:hypothetical protein